MQANYNQAAPKIIYDFSDENVAHVQKILGMKKEAKEIMAPLELLKEKIAQKPSYDTDNKYLCIGLQANAQNYKSNAENHHKSVNMKNHGL